MYIFGKILPFIFLIFYFTTSAVSEKAVYAQRRQEKSRSCLHYGHSCWGAHGKRSGYDPSILLSKLISMKDNYVPFEDISSFPSNDHENPVRKMVHKFRFSRDGKNKDFQNDGRAIAYKYFISRMQKPHYYQQTDTKETTLKDNVNFDYPIEA